MAILLLFLRLGLMTLETAGSSVSGGTPNVSAAVFGGGHSHASAVCGVIIAPIAVVFMIYALWTIVRAKRIARRELSTRYDDVFGPVALVVILCVVATASIALSAASVDWNRHAYARPTRS